jgi:hypothetical protein
MTSTFLVLGITIKEEENEIEVRSLEEGEYLPKYTA